MSSQIKCRLFCPEQAFLDLFLFSHQHVLSGSMTLKGGAIDEGKILPVRAHPNPINPLYCLVMVACAPLLLLTLSKSCWSKWDAI